MLSKVRLQVIKVYDVVVAHKPSEHPIDKVYDMSTEEIQRDGRLVDVTTDFAEVIGKEEL